MAVAVVRSGKRGGRAEDGGKRGGEKGSGGDGEIGRNGLFVSCLLYSFSPFLPVLNFGPRFGKGRGLAGLQVLLAGVGGGYLDQIGFAAKGACGLIVAAKEVVKFRVCAHGLKLFAARKVIPGILRVVNLCDIVVVIQIIIILVVRNRRVQ